MSLNIKNPRVHELAREAARVTGKTQTGVILEALERLLSEYGADPLAAEEERRRARVDELRTWFAEHPGDPDQEIRTIEDLYDPETGLPR